MDCELKQRPPWRCPHASCRRPLDEDGGGAWCASGHRFDRAREGYLNLLPGGRLPARERGDSSAMLAARRALFDAGHYRPVQDAVAGVVASFAPHTVLDAGCGEGSYLAAVDAPVRLGVDVAKPAVRMAARRHRAVAWAVASSYYTPLGEACVDVVMSVFAPRALREFERVLRPGGVAVVASPGPDHLDGLTTLVYGEPRRHRERATLGDGERAHRDVTVAETRVRYTLALSAPADVANLLQMTPYWWKASASQRDAISALDSLTTTVDVIVTAHRF